MLKDIITELTGDTENELEEKFAWQRIELINKNNAAEENKEKKTRKKEEAQKRSRKHRMRHRTWLAEGGSCKLLKRILGKRQMHLRSS